MKKKIILLVAGLFLLAFFYSGYKAFILYKYTFPKSSTEKFLEFTDKFKDIDKITIQHKETNEEYLEFNNVRIRNDFKEFNQLSITENSAKYCLYDENEEFISAIFIECEDSLISSIMNEYYVGKENDEVPPNINISKILDENNITKDIELFSSFATHNTMNNNMFTSIKKIKTNYFFQYLGLLIIPNAEYLTEIDGDYTGYIFDTEKVKEVSIIKNDKRYIFTFINTDYFTDEYIKELLETIIIE